MGWNKALGALKNELPHFNDYLLKGYRREQVARYPDFMSTVFKEAIKLFHGRLKYHGYQILPPEQVVDFYQSYYLFKGKYNIQQSETSLVKFLFDFDGNPIETCLFLPYMHDNALMLNDTKYYIQLAIIEKMIFRVRDGVIIKVLRSPLQFWRSEQLTYTDTTGEQYCDAVITVRAHYRRAKSSKKGMKTPLVLYLLAKFDFQRVMQILSIPAESVSFVEEVNPDDEQYVYFECRENIYLKVDKEVIMSEKQHRRFIVSLLYIIKQGRRYSISQLLDTTFYKAILGRSLYPNVGNDALAAGHAESHLDSLSTYLDEYTKNELAMLSIYCENIFDLFVHVFGYIDEWLNWYSANDLFAKRIGGADLVLMEMVRIIFTRFYVTQRNHTKVLEFNDVRSMLKIPAMSICKLSSIQSLRPNAALYNDNDMIALDVKKIRQSSTQENTSKKSSNIITDKEHRFHPSFVAVESPLAISSSSPGISGDINPFVVIDKMGYFHKEKMPWYQEIEGLVKYLTQV